MTSCKDTREFANPPPYSITESASKPDGIFRSSNKKIAVIGSVTVVVAIVVTAGILCGIFLQNRFTKDIVKECCTVSVHNEDGSKAGNLKVDAEKNQQEYNSLDGSLKVLYDFNKEIVVIITDQNCYVKPLNTTSMMHPRVIKRLVQQGKHVLAKMDDSIPSKPEITFEPGNEPISDHSFLGNKARELCKDKSARWMYPKQGRIGKRGVRVRVSIRIRIRISFRRSRKRR